MDCFYMIELSHVVVMWNVIVLIIYIYVFKVIKFVFISVVNKISQSSARDHMQYCCVTVAKKLSTLSSALKTHAVS